MAKPSAQKTHFSPNGGLIKKLGTHFRTPLPTASVSTLNSDQHLGVTIVVVVRRIIVAVFRVVVVAVLVPLRPDGQLMSYHHQQEDDREADQDDQEDQADQENQDDQEHRDDGGVRPGPRVGCGEGTGEDQHQRQVPVQTSLQSN